MYFTINVIIYTQNINQLKSRREEINNIIPKMECIRSQNFFHIFRLLHL